jgi:hypothetical protein
MGKVAKGSSFSLELYVNVDRVICLLSVYCWLLLITILAQYFERTRENEDNDVETLGTITNSVQKRKAGPKGRSQNGHKRLKGLQ